MALQAAPGAGVTTQSFSTLVAPPGTNPPAANNFPGGAGSTVEGPSGVFFKDDGTIPDGAFRDNIGAFTTYTPAWTGATTNPTGATIDGRYVKHGKMYDCHITITVGAGLGSGSYSLTLPAAPARGRRIFPGIARDTSSSDDYEIFLICSAGSTTGSLKTLPTTAGNMLRLMNSTVPFALAAGDTICFDFTYEAA